MVLVNVLGLKSNTEYAMTTLLMCVVDLYCDITQTRVLTGKQDVGCPWPDFCPPPPCWEDFLSFTLFKFRLLPKVAFVSVVLLYYSSACRPLR